MKWAIGKLTSQEKKILIFTEWGNMLYGVEAKSALKSLASGLAGAAANFAAEMGADALLDNVPGGGLISSVAGDMAEKKMAAKVEEAMSAGLKNKSEEEIQELISNGKDLLTVPTEKIINVSMKKTGMVKKRFQVQLKEKGFWIFNTTHKLTFSMDQKDQAEALFTSFQN